MAKCLPLESQDVICAAKRVRFRNVSGSWRSGLGRLECTSITGQQVFLFFQGFSDLNTFKRMAVFTYILIIHVHLCLNMTGQHICTT